MMSFMEGVIVEDQYKVCFGVVLKWISFEFLEKKSVKLI